MLPSFSNRRWPSCNPPKKYHAQVGTPLYMSPEVLRGGGYSWKSDVWSLGCLLYELAMLRSPFKSEGLNLYSLFQKINTVGLSASRGCSAFDKQPSNAGEPRPNEAQEKILNIDERV